MKLQFHSDIKSLSQMLNAQYVISAAWGLSIKNQTKVKVVRCRARPSEGINTPSRIKLCSMTGRRESLDMKLFGLKMDLSSLLLSNLTAALICKGDPHCPSFMYCHVNCRMKPIIHLF